MPGELKQCPFCAEEVKSAAILCKHCKSDLQSGRSSKQEQPTVQNDGTPEDDVWTKAKLAQQLFLEHRYAQSESLFRESLTLGYRLGISAGQLQPITDDLLLVFQAQGKDLDAEELTALGSRFFDTDREDSWYSAAQPSSSNPSGLGVVICVLAIGMMVWFWSLGAMNSPHIRTGNPGENSREMQQINTRLAKEKAADMQAALLRQDWRAARDLLEQVSYHATQSGDEQLQQTAEQLRSDFYRQYPAAR